VVPPAELDAAVSETVDALETKSGAATLLGRDSFYGILDLDFDAALDRLQTGLTAIASSGDAAEGIAAFKEKRPPVWGEPGR
jgi:enoyl-CoA hydratase/carnithine racemase